VGEQRRTGLVAAFAAPLAEAPSRLGSPELPLCPGLLADAGLCAAVARSWCRSRSGRYGRPPPHGLRGKFAGLDRVYSEMRTCRCEGKLTSAQIAAARSAGAAGVASTPSGICSSVPAPPRRGARRDPGRVPARPGALGRRGLSFGAAAPSSVPAWRRPLRRGVQRGISWVGGRSGAAAVNAAASLLARVGRITRFAHVFSTSSSQAVSATARSP
jgi:hypothetical protein